MRCMNPDFRLLDSFLMSRLLSQTHMTLKKYTWHLALLAASNPTIKKIPADRACQGEPSELVRNAFVMNVAIILSGT